MNSSGVFKNPEMIEFSKKMNNFYEHLAKNDAKYNENTPEINEKIKEILEKQTEKTFGKAPKMVK